MDNDPNNTITIDNQLELIEKKIINLIHQNDTVSSKVFNSLESISKMIECIVNSGGKNGWSDNLHIDNMSNESKKQLEDAMKPYVKLVVDFFKSNSNIISKKGGERKISLKKRKKVKGGNQPSDIPNPPTNSNNPTPSVYPNISSLDKQIAENTARVAAMASAPLINISNGVPTVSDLTKGVPSMGQLTQSGFVETIKDVLSYTPLKSVVEFAEQNEKLYNDGVALIQNIREFANQISGTIGTTRFITSYDTEDPQPFYYLKLLPPTPLTAPLIAASNIRIPARTLLFVTYVILDTIRIIFATSNRPIVKSLVILPVVIFDILRGDWKSALLTFLSFFGKYPMLIGTYLKLALIVYQYIIPPVGSFTNPCTPLGSIFGFSKSLIADILSRTFETFAPAELRKNIQDELNKVRLSFEKGAKPVGITDNINFFKSMLYSPDLCNSPDTIPKLKAAINTIKGLSAILCIVLLLFDMEKQLEQACKNKCTTNASPLKPVTTQTVAELPSTNKPVITQTMVNTTADNDVK